MILFIQLLLQIVSIPLFLFVSGSTIEQDCSTNFVQPATRYQTNFWLSSREAPDKLWTSTWTGSVALYKHYKLYKHNKPNKTRVSKYAPAPSSSENELVREWAGEKEKGYNRRLHQPSDSTKHAEDEKLPCKT